MTVRIEFDGGNGCNNPTKGYGEGYGSFCFNTGPVLRVRHGRPMSNNAAELWTLVSAVEYLSNNWSPRDLRLLIVGDSQIALSWANRAHQRVMKCASKGSSEEMLSSISRLRELLPHFQSVTTQWQPRVKSVRTFGH